MERGFVPIFVILAVLAILGAVGSFVVVSNFKEKEEKAVTAPVPETIDSVPEYISKKSPLSKNVVAQESADGFPRGFEKRVSKSPTPKPQTNETPTPKNNLPSHEGNKLAATTPLFVPTPPPTNAKITDLEREITILFEGGRPIGPEHYTRLSNKLNTEAAGGADMELVKKLRNMLETVNPNAVPRTSSSAQSSQSSNTCATDTKPKLTNDFTQFSKIRKITAPGSPSAEGPKGHSFVWTEHERVPIYAPIVMTLDSGTYVKDTAESPAQYLLFFMAKDNCDYQIKFDHIDEPIPSIREQFPETPAVADSRSKAVSQRIQFQPGDLIGYTAGTNEAGNWDFGLYNIREKGVLATQYNSYGLHGYAVCWVDFYLAEKQAQYRQLLEGPKLLCSF